MHERRITRRPQCVLVVDDMVDARELWTGWLERSGPFATLMRRTAVEAFVKHAADQPSVDPYESLDVEDAEGTAAI